MKIRNASFVWLCVGLFSLLAAGQNTASSVANPLRSAKEAVAAPSPGSETLAPEDKDPRHLRMFFTGYLLGYYRLPQWQGADFEAGCPNAAEDNQKWKDEFKPPKSIDTPAEQFLEALYGSAHRSDNSELLVGMGDSFGVSLESRTWRDRPIPEKPWELHAKSRNPAGQWSSSSPLTSGEIGDNVGCFLYRAGYDAIVPGKDDFYFGPERLRSIAARLAAAPKQNATLSFKSSGAADTHIEYQLHPVRMLAANLIIETDYLEKPRQIPDSEKTLKFFPGMPRGVESVDISDKGTLFPYMRQIRFKIAPTSLYSVSGTGSGNLQPFLCAIDQRTTTWEGLDQLDPDPKSTECRQIPLVLAFQDTTTEDGETAYFTLPSEVFSQAKLPALFGLCVHRDTNDEDYKPARAREYYCARFTVARPLFWTDDPDAKAESEADKKKSDLVKELNKPYVVKTLANGQGYAAVFGVVDPSLAALAGRDNLSWRNNHRRVEAKEKTPSKSKLAKEGDEVFGTTVGAIDPTTALLAAMRHFDLEWKPVPAGAKVYKVLLAQMERGKAETLGAQLANTKFCDTELNFDVIVSAAADGAAATTRESVIFQPKPEKREADTEDSKKPESPCSTQPKKDAPVPAGVKPKASPRYRQFVVVPFKGYEDRKLLNPVRQLDLTESIVPEQRQFEVDYRQPPTPRKDIFDAFETDKTVEPPYDGMGRAYLAGKGYWHAEYAVKPPPLHPNPAEVKEETKLAAQKNAPPTLKNPFQIAALAVLRERTHADVAMLQKRSFYFGPFPNPLNQTADNHPNGETLDRIFWMGDYLEVLTVKGSTLKKVLDDSDKLDALDETGAIEGAETGRGLITFGIQKTRDEQYLVDGIQLDPNRLYTVATSNHISAGDNGYPELADPTFDDPQLPKPDKEGGASAISSLLCQELGGESCTDRGALQFAAANDLPSQLEPTRKDRLEAYKNNFLRRPSLLKDGNSLVDYRAQLDPTWRFSLKDLTFNFNAVRNNLTEVDRANLLAGVSDPSANNPKSSAVDIETHLEWVRNTQNVDEFVRGSLLYKVNATGNTAPVPITTATGTTTETVPALRLFQFVKNQAAGDAGFFLHAPPHKYSNRIGLVLEPMHWDTQIVHQPLELNAQYNPAGMIIAEPFVKDQPRVYKFLGRVAFRMEGDKNFFEFGYQAGREFNALASLGSCDSQAIATQSLTTCLQTLQSMSGFTPSSLQPTTEQRERNGIYGNLDWTTPMFWRLSLRTQDALEYYRPAHLDNSTDTKYRNDYTEILSVQVWPNLTIGPSLERFDYENKINDIHLRTWTPGINITYSFDVYRGGSWSKSVKYGPNAASAGGGS